MGQEETDVLESTTPNKPLSVSSSDAKSCASQDQVKMKMEAMQKRIDELKEKVKYEGELLTNEEQSISLENIESSSSELERFDDRLSQEKSVTSDTSLYFSASNFSFGSINSELSDSTQENFSKFINNFVRNQNFKERLSLLQLHSSKQISMNMMRRSLAELDLRCSQELKVIENSLQHLERLAVDINRSSNAADHENSGSSRKSKTEEFLLNPYDSGRPDENSVNATKTVDVYNNKIRKAKTMTFLWAPLERKSTFELDWKKNPAFVKRQNEDSLE